MRNWIGHRIGRAFTGLFMALAFAGALAGCALSPEEQRAQLEEQLVEHPNTGETWRAIKRHFPDDFDTYVASIVDLPVSDQMSEDAVMANEMRWFNGFLARTQPAAFVAPLPELLKFRDAQRAMAEAVEAHSIALCARYSNGEELGMIDMGDAARKASAAHNAAMIRSAAAGMRDPQNYDLPSDAEWRQLGNQMLADGVPERILVMMDDEASFMAASEADRCTGGTSFHRALAGLPDELSVKLFVAANMPSGPQ